MVQKEIRGLPSRIYPKGVTITEAGCTRRCVAGIVSGCVVQRGEEMAAEINNAVVRRKGVGDIFGLVRFWSTSNRGACSDVNFLVDARTVFAACWIPRLSFGSVRCCVAAPTLLKRARSEALRPGCC